jgi:hypothetical protein
MRPWVGSVCRAICAVLVAGTGCTRTVSMRFEPSQDASSYVAKTDAPRPMKGHLQENEVALDSVTEVGGQTVRIVWDGRNRDQIRDRVEQGLRAQPCLGGFTEAPRKADYSLRTSTAYSASWKTNTGWVLLGVLTFMASTAAGMGLGYAIGGQKYMAAGGGIGEITGALVWLGLPQRGHHHVWTTTLAATDSEGVQFFKKSYTTTADYDTSIYTDTEARHSRAASDLFRGHLDGTLAGLERDLVPGLAALPPPRSEVPPPKPVAETRKIAVMEILDGTGRLDRDVLGSASEYLRFQVISSGRFVVIDKTRQAEELRNLVKREKLESYKDCYDVSCQIPLGQALAADSLLHGSIGFLGGVHILSLQLVDLAKEASVLGATAEFDGTAKGLKEAIDRAVGELGTRLAK